jgi:hypothetical protein
MKDLARRLLQSDDWHDAHEGFGILCKITDEVAERPLEKETRNGIEYKTMELLKLTSLFLDSYEEYRSGGGMSVIQRLDRAKEETAFYFVSMFKAGHFEQLPMPEFWYELTDPGEEGTAEGAIAAAKIIASQLPVELKMTIPPQQPEDGIAFGSFPESHKLG